MTLYAGIGIRATAGGLLMLGDPVLLSLFGIFELHPALLAPFLIRVSLVSRAVLHLKTTLSFAFPLVFGLVPLAVLAREPSRLVFGAMLIGCRVQNRQSLRVPHVARFADPEQLSARTGRIRWQIDEVLGREVAQAEAATLILALPAARTDRAGTGAARSRGCSQVMSRMQTALQVADQRLSADHARRGQMRQRAVQSLLRIHVLQAVPLHVVQKLGLRREATAAYHACIAQLDLAMLLELVLGQTRAGRAYFVADIALVTTTGFIGRVLNPRVRFQLASRATDLTTIATRHAQSRERFVGQLRGCVGEFLVCLQLSLVREFTALAELALLTGSAIIQTLVVIALVQRIVVA